MNLAQKIWEVKKAMPLLRKETEGFGFKYVSLFDIEKALLPLLDKYQLGVFHELAAVEGGRVILHTSVVDFADNSTVQSSIFVPYDIPLPKQNGYQAIGSAITYFKRYNITTLFDILGTDEDIDVLNAKSEPLSEPTKVDYIDKVRSLISLGRKRANLERYFAEYQSKMSEEEKTVIIEIIKNAEV